MQHTRNTRPVSQQKVHRVTASLATQISSCVFGTGFAHPETIHNAAHDTRHAFAFPCH